MKQNNLKNALIQEALKAFAKTDYKKVSTNAIVKEAKVSKGLLFHYFENKETLYIKLYDMVLNIIYKETFANFLDQERDFFERLKYIIIKQSEVLRRYKMLSAFLRQVHINQDPSIIKRRIRIYKAMVHKRNVKLMENVNPALFKNQDYLDEIYKVITWTMQRLQHEWEKNAFELENDQALIVLEKELTHYTEFFKMHFYR